jgi:hypothetical protein
MSWAVLFLVVFLIVFMALAGSQHLVARTVRVCADVNLPAPGTCTHQTIRGFRVSVCR